MSYRDDHGGLAFALAAGDAAAQAQRADEQYCGVLLTLAFDEACTAAGLPRGAFRWQDDNRRDCDLGRVPLCTVLRVQVCGDVYFPSMFANEKSFDIGELEVTRDDAWIVNDDASCSDARAAVAALLRTALAGASIQVARQRFVYDVKQARKNLAARQRWAFWSRAAIAVLLAALPIAYLAGSFLYLDLFSLVLASGSLAFAVDGIEYDERTVKAHAHVDAG